MAIYTLAKYTIKGYFKERILLVVLLFAFLLMGASYALSPLAVGAQSKIVIDIGLAAISLFGVILIVLLGAGSYHQEKEQGILKNLLVKPMTRADFVIGKYLGTAITVIAVTLLTALIYLGFVALSGNPITANILLAVYLAVVEVMIVTAILTLFSSFTSPVLASFFTITTVVAGHLSKNLLAFADRFDDAIPAMVMKVFYFILPNLSLTNIRSEAVHNLPLLDGFVSAATLYAAFYVAVLLKVSVLLFESKEVN